MSENGIRDLFRYLTTREMGGAQVFLEKDSRIQAIKLTGFEINEVELHAFSDIPTVYSVADLARRFLNEMGQDPE